MRKTPSIFTPKGLRLTTVSREDDLCRADENICRLEIERMRNHYRHGELRCPYYTLILTLPLRRLLLGWESTKRMVSMIF